MRLRLKQLVLCLGLVVVVNSGASGLVSAVDGPVQETPAILTDGHGERYQRGDFVSVDFFGCARNVVAAVSLLSDHRQVRARVADAVADGDGRVLSTFAVPMVTASGEVFVLVDCVSPQGVAVRGSVMMTVTDGVAQSPGTVPAVVRRPPPPPAYPPAPNAPVPGGVVPTTLAHTGLGDVGQTAIGVAGACLIVGLALIACASISTTRRRGVSRNSVPWGIT